METATEATFWHTRKTFTPTCGARSGTKTQRKRGMGEEKKRGGELQIAEGRLQIGGMKAEKEPQRRRGTEEKRKREKG